MTSNQDKLSADTKESECSVQFRVPASDAVRARVLLIPSGETPASKARDLFYEWFRSEQDRQPELVAALERKEAQAAHDAANREQVEILEAEAAK